MRAARVPAHRRLLAARRLHQRRSSLAASVFRRWQPLNIAARGQRVVALAREIAGRFSGGDIIDRAVTRARAATREPASIYWHPYTIAQGDAGIALMFGYFDSCFPDEGWDRIAHVWVERAARGAETAERLPNGLFEGISGLAFVVNYLSRGGQRYRTLHRRLHEFVMSNLQTQLKAFDDSARHGVVPFPAWDAISGLTGIGAYLLAVEDHKSLRPVLKRLVALTKETKGLPAWHTPTSFSSDWMRHAYPEGHLNCGLAHGIPGPLALLSLARLGAVKVPGIDEAIDRIARWLSAHSLNDSWGRNWPSAVPLVRGAGGLCQGTCEGLEATHAGWCYGSPGVARSLWLAGKARRNAGYRDVAVETMRAVIRRPPDARRLSSPTLCHGFAGLLCVSLRFRQDLPERGFTRFARYLVRHIEQRYEPESLLGYRTTEPGGGCIDQAGMLDGAPGVAMALLAAATAKPPSWDRLFLLS